MELTAKFLPTKGLFIDVLTRDLNIQDCILDLLDNSVDSYARNNASGRKEIKIIINKDLFEVYDSCGGIALDKLEKEVFRIGLSHKTGDISTIGMYGIGLKRAMFKIGKEILFETDDGMHYAKLDMNVDSWLAKEDSWEWPLIAEESKLTAEDAKYTRITITNINEEVGEVFDNAAFINTLIKHISVYYSMIIEHKIDFFVNDIKIDKFELKIKMEQDIEPSQKYIEYDGVTIRVLCWIQAKDVKRTAREITSRGWNIFMNDRLILLDDTSTLTGWTGEKDQLPRFHQIYNDFRGLVFLNTNYPSKLPINTPKNSFNTETKIYKMLIDKMIDVAKPIIGYLSKKYSEPKGEIDNKELELETDIAKEQTDNVKVVTLQEIERQEKTFKPPVFKTRPVAVSIQYRKPKDEADAVKKYLGVTTYGEVGKMTFDHFVKSEGLADE
jgi:hypothetical protein